MQVGKRRFFRGKVMSYEEDMANWGGVLKYKGMQ